LEAGTEPEAEQYPLIAGKSVPPAPKVLTVDEIDALVAQREAGSAFQPVLVAENLPRAVAMRVEEQRYRLPGVELHLESMRDYPAGSDVAHVIGYMGPIPEETKDSYEEKGYNADAWVGWTGLEFTYEDVLRGIPGVRVIEVDVNGHEQAVIGEERPAQPGQNLILSLDLELQKAMLKAMEKHINPDRSHSAVAIAIDPRNGFVRGMVSLPSYDNNVFADGITGDEYRDISEAPGNPLINHATSGIYPPGSTFKMVPAAAGLQEKVITARTLLNAPGIIYVPNRNFPDNPLLAQPFVCWIYKQGGYHGDLNVVQALGESCDIFFYKLGGGWYATDFEGLGVDTLAEYATEFGFGEPTGIDLPAEHGGLIPNPKWKRIAKGERWVTGDTYNMSIGQGDVLATPLQVTMMTTIVANDGSFYRPQLIEAITDSESHLVQRMQPDLIREIPVDSKHLATVRQGMWMAVNWEHGTAKNVALPDVTVAGKTGTAEFFDPDIPRDGRGNLPSHAWFTAFAPYEDPEIVVTVFVFNGGEGSAVAAPITKEILRSYFDIKARDEAEGSQSILEQMEEQTP
ncbi:MAG TPA: penicillin-binding protein 2, partial [Caldilineae bacterium]|nr:penicillin-binding protein 2 [Caldilineae bacterium]